MVVQDLSPIPIDAFTGRAHEAGPESGVVPLDLSEYLGERFEWCPIAFAVFQRCKEWWTSRSIQKICFSHVAFIY